MTTTDTPRTDSVCFKETMESAEVVLATFARDLERQLEASKAEAELEKLKAGKVFVDPKWIYDLETQLAKAHEELCQAGLREYGN